MALTPMVYDGGGYKYTYYKVEELKTANQYRAIVFDAGKIVLDAAFVVGGTAYPMIVYSGANNNFSNKYIDGTQLKEFTANSSYTVVYEYLQAVT